jgi:hypothetical protein
MKLLVLADIHGRFEQVHFLTEKARDCDAIIAAGDITNFGGRDEVLEVLSAFKPFGKPILAVHGNCDRPAVLDVLQEQGISLHGRSIALQGLVFVGAGGSLPCPGRTPNEFGDSVFSAVMEQSLAGIVPNSRLVLVTHQPPWGTTVDVQASTRHTGSRMIRSFIEDYQPLLAVSGHIHEARSIDRLASTVLVNPGPFKNGCYATIEITDTDIQAHLDLL